MPESWTTRCTRWYINWAPAYRGTGGRLEYIAHDWTEVRVRLPLSWRTRNIVGTIFGGSLYGAIDPVYMLMLMHTLGPEFVVWDKAATIHFLKPARSTLWATFQLTASRISELRSSAMAQGKSECHFDVELADRDGLVHARCRKTLHVRWKAAGASPRDNVLPDAQPNPPGGT